MKDNMLRKLLKRSEFMVLCILVAIWVILSLINKNYGTLNNLAAIMKTMSWYGIIAVGLSFVIIQGDSDVSTGASAGFSAVFGTALMLETGCMGMLGTANEWIGVVICTLIAMAFGALIGMGNACMVVRFNMPPFIATVAMQYVLNGLKMVITSGAYVYPLPNSLIQFVKLGIAMPRGKIAVSFIILLGLLVIAHFILSHTTYGRSVYATGSNRIMAQLSGVKTNRVRYINYMVLHALVAMVGVLNAGYMKQGSPGIGTDWHLTIMAACAIGGIKFSGGSGNMIGLLIGLFTLFSINSAIAYIGINTFLQDVIIGLILMVIMVSDRVRANRKIRA
ncbi:MAG: ABC transporter permease [Clostridia bacterium]|nr:ABC transporter permease [Clostridia bacterium]